jgi:hypothetical protein
MPIDNVELTCHLAAVLVITPFYFKYCRRDGAEVVIFVLLL